MPIMGMTTNSRRKPAVQRHRSVTSKRRSSLIDALFSVTQRKVLGLLFGQTERSFFTTEIISRVGSGSGAVQRELLKLEESGLVTVTKLGNQKHFQANPASPIYNELASIMRKTIGVADPLRQALESISGSISFACIYGSIAKGQEKSSSDIDLLVLSDSLTLEVLYRHLEEAESALGRKINPILFTLAEFNKRRSSSGSFVSKVLAGETIVLTGQLPDAWVGAGESGKDRSEKVATWYFSV